MTEAAPMDVKRSSFDPGQHLTKIKGQDYLEVKWRLAWLRAEHPDAILETELRAHENGRAVFFARVALPAGAIATGWGSETVDSFENYIEKAETKAIGRALAAIGFGTQFCDDFNDAGAMADAPVGARAQGSTRQSGTGSAPRGPEPATAAQKSMIQYKAKEAGMTLPELADFIANAIHPEANLDNLLKGDASKVIDALGEIGGGR